MSFLTDILGGGKEYNEREVLKNAQWLGGTVEVGRGMGFSLYPRKGKIYTYPYIHATDDEEERVRFNSRFGGRVNRRGNSWEWKIEGDDAVSIAVASQMYSPSRADTNEAFISWRNAQSREERVAVAANIRAIDRTKVSQRDYESLIYNPLFLAGVLDERGNVYARESLDSDAPYAHFVAASTNKTLLDALQFAYEGKIYPKEIEGYLWEMEDIRKIRNLYSNIKRELKFKSKIHKSLWRDLGI